MFVKNKHSQVYSSLTQKESQINLHNCKSHKKTQTKKEKKITRGSREPESLTWLDKQHPIFVKSTMFFFLGK